MKVIEPQTEHQEYIRIMIGKAIHGQSGILAPTRIMTLEKEKGENITVNDIFDLIKKMFKEKKI